MKANHDPLRRFLSAALCDFVGYLDELGDPIVVGGQYPKDKLVQAFRKWCEDRNICVKDPDCEGWLTACSTNAMEIPGKLPPKPPIGDVDITLKPEAGYFEGEKGEDWKEGTDDASAE